MEYKIYGLRVRGSKNIRYIGRTSETLEIRLRKHFYNAKYTSKKNHKDYWLLKNFDDIEVFLIEDGIETFEDSCELEKMYIKKYRKTDPLINLTDGGDGGCPGYKHTEEAKRKIGDSHRGKKLTEEHKEILRNRKISDETRRKMSESNKEYQRHNPNPMLGKKRPDNIKRNKDRTGWKMNDESRKLLSDMRRGDDHPMCKIKDNEIDIIIELYKSGYNIKELSIEYDVTYQTIYRIIKGKRKKSIKNID